MIVVVTGSRDWTDRETIRKFIAALPKDATVVHGDCHLGGADALADELARERGLKVEKVPVNHAIDGQWPGAGPRRNRRMLDCFLPQLVVGFPTETAKGTWDCLREAKRRNIPCLRFRSERGR